MSSTLHFLVLSSSLFTLFSLNPISAISLKLLMEFRAMHKFAVFLLAVIACHLVHLSVDGRQLKSVSKNESIQSSQADKYEMHKEDHEPAVPSYNPNAAQHSVSSKSSDFGGSVSGHKADFRPTTPRKSPGVGNSLPEDDEDVEQKSRNSPSNDKHSIARVKEDVRPTNPGHSLGVGDSFPSKTSEPNA